MQTVYNKSISLVLHVPLIEASFVETDQQLLQTIARVETFRSPWVKTTEIFISLLNQILWLFQHVRNADAIVCSFAGYSSVLPSLVGRICRVKTVVVVHGTECAAIPTLEYGMLRKTFLRACVGLSLKLCDSLVVSNETLLRSNDTYSDGLTGEQGLLAHFRLKREKIVSIRYGFDSTFWAAESLVKTPNSFLAVILPGQQKRRDLPLLIEVAKRFSECQFTIVGLTSKDLTCELPSNICLRGVLSQKQMKEEFSVHRFFIQLSLYEGFGCAVVESMLCECIPIVSNVNALPEIVGSTGHVLSTRNFQEAIQVISTALDEYLPENAALAREWVVSNYPVESRLKSLEKVLG